MASTNITDHENKVGTTLVVAPLNPDTNNDSSTQLWSFEGDGTISNVATGLVIDIEGNKNEPGAKVIAYPKDGGVNQQWRLIPKSRSSQRFFHGDPARDNSFWIYPHNKKLITSRWDTYNPYLLCNNFAVLDISQQDGIHRYKCQGHDEQYVGQQEYVKSLQNHTAVSLKSLGHLQGKHWLNSSHTGVNLLAINAPSSTFWYVYVHSTHPLVVSLRCHDPTGTNQQWFTRTNNNKITLGGSENAEEARSNVTFTGNQSTCLLSNTIAGGQTMFLDGYTTIGAVGLVAAPYNNRNYYTGAYWKVIIRK